MRWWLITDPPCVMSVDNASVGGMDFSELIIDDPDLYMVHWTEGKGEIERQNVVDGAEGDTNLNGLREGFYDVTPYVPLFQQFLERMQAKNLLLDEAKKVQIDLIKQLYESKRQMPFHYPVAAGDYWWDASDDTMGASTALSTQNITTTVNQLIVAVNKLVTDINAVFDQITTGISGVGNIFVSQVNSIVVNGVNAGLVNSLNPIFSSLASEINDGITQNGNLTINHINGSSFVDLINANLHTGLITSGEFSYNVATPGLPNSVNVADIPYTFGPVSTYSVAYIGSVAPGTFVTVAHVPATGMGSVPTTNVQWIPIGGTTPVNVTPAEQAAIMQGIAARTNQLNLIKNTKIAEVNALTTVAAVIDYDVLAGWPVMPVPPGWKLEAPTTAASSVTVVGQPPAPSGGIPEAPSDNVTYGRRNMVWNPALALSGDVLDGGTF